MCKGEGGRVGGFSNKEAAKQKVKAQGPSTIVRREKKQGFREQEQEMRKEEEGTTAPVSDRGTITREFQYDDEGTHTRNEYKKDAKKSQYNWSIKMGAKKQNLEGDKAS